MATDSSTALHQTALSSHDFANAILTEAELAKVTRLSGRTLQRLAEDGRGPPRIYLTERRVGYWGHDVLAWLKTRTAPSKEIA